MHGVEGIVVAQVGFHFGGQPGHSRQDPAVERAAIGDRGSRLGGLPAGLTGVRDEERVDVPQHQQPPARLVRGVPAEVDVVLGPGVGEHPAHHVRAHPLGGLVELDGVAPALVHLTAVFAVDQRIPEQRLERRLAAQHRAHGQQRVEPVAELAGEALGHEVGREPALPELGVFTVVQGRERHDPGVQPRVAHVSDAGHGPAAARAADLHRVHVRPVRGVALEFLPALDRQLGQLFAAANHGHDAALAVVDRQRQAPVALLADHPVVHVQQPVQLPFVAESRYPANAFDDLHDLVAQAGVDLGRGQLLTRLVVDRAHADVPLVHQAEDEGRAAAPAVGVAVGDRLESVEAVLVLQRIEDGVGHIAHVTAGVRPEARDDRPVLVQRGDQRQTQRLAQGEVLGAAARGNVDDTGALFLADLVPQHDAVLVGFAVLRRDRRECLLYGR